MSSISPCLRSVIFGATLTVIASNLVFAADPKITRASHQTESKSIPKKFDDSRSEPRSLEIEQRSDAAPASDTVTEPELAYSPQWPEPPNAGAMLLRLGMGTFTVLALSVGTIWFARPLLKRMQVRSTGTSSFFVEGSVAVGNRAVLYLVRVGETQLVAGTDAGGLKSLIALPASFKDVLEEQLPAAEAAPPLSPPPYEVRIPTRSIAKE